jgi:hypothetical protein
MADRKPLVLATDQENPLQQLQGGDELDIPLEERFQQLKQRFDLLVVVLLNTGFELPEEVIQHGRNTKRHRLELGRRGTGRSFAHGFAG